MTDILHKKGLAQQTIEGYLAVDNHHVNILNGSFISATALVLKTGHANTDDFIINR